MSDIVTNCQPYLPFKSQTWSDPHAAGLGRDTHPASQAYSAQVASEFHPPSVVAVLNPELRSQPSERDPSKMRAHFPQEVSSSLMASTARSLWHQISSYSASTTITAPHSRDQQNGEEKRTDVHSEEDICPKMNKDIHDPTYQDAEGPLPKLEYVWRNIILMVVLHVGALYGITLVPTCKFYTCLFGIVYIAVGGLGVTAGAHRLWSHRTYKARLPLRLFLIIANTMAFQNDVYEWSRDHRVHHKFTETHADPHNSRRGFFFSHVGWLLVRKHPAVKEKGGKLDMSDLEAEKLVMFQRRYYKPAVLLICIILPTLVPWYFWDETFQHSLHVATFLRYATMLHLTWLVNSAAHLYGCRPYDKSIGPRENPLVSMATFGEGFHNYHHTFPFDYSASEYHWHINFTTFFIDCMAVLGLAYDRKKVSKAAVLARIKRTGDGSHKSD